MDRDRLAQALLATFLEELEGHVSALNAVLLQLEQAAAPAERAAQLQALLRTLHTVKGSARAAGVGLVETTCHQLEERLAALRERPEVVPGSDTVQLLFSAADALEDARRRLAEQRELAGGPLEALLATLSGAPPPPPAAPAATPGPTAQAPAAAPAPTPAEAAPPPAVPGAPAPGPGPVRVSAQKLDMLQARSSEMRVATLRLEARVEALEATREALARARADVHALPQVEAQLASLTRDLAADRRELARTAAALDEEVRRVRTLPFAEACAGLERALRDVARSSGRQARLEVQGGTLELDRALVTGLREPLLHLVRNAVAHGLEAPAERARAGKPPEGQVRVSARLAGGRVRVVVEDDGAGLDVEALRAEALRRGLPLPASAPEVAQLVFVPGLSTARRVDALSGRGVGLDAVRVAVEALRGRVDVASTPGSGARFGLDVPLTLGSVRVLLVQAAAHTWALPSEDVQRLVRPSSGDVRAQAGREVLSLDGQALPLAALGALLRLGDPAGRPPAAAARPAAMVLGTAGLQVALVVDAALSEEEALVRALPARLVRAHHLSGVALLPDGSAAPLLQPASLVRAALRLPAAGPLFTPPAPPARRRILLVDDAPTTRALEQSILESAGYEVMACADGEEAWERLEREGADALVADVEMPRLDGFGLTERVRASARFGRLPVVLVTGREREEDRRRGLEAGASAYLVKSAFDPTELLGSLERLL